MPANTEVSFFLSVADVGHECNVAGTLDSNGQLTLMLCTCTGDTAGQDLRSLGNELLQTNGILVIDFIDLICTESADFLSSAVERTGGTLCDVGSRSGFSLLCGLLYFFSYSGFISFHIHAYETSC